MRRHGCSGREASGRCGGAGATKASPSRRRSLFCLALGRGVLTPRADDDHLWPLPRTLLREGGGGEVRGEDLFVWQRWQPPLPPRRIVLACGHVRRETAGLLRLAGLPSGGGRVSFRCVWVLYWGRREYERFCREEYVDCILRL